MLRSAGLVSLVSLLFLLAPACGGGGGGYKDLAEGQATELPGFNPLPNDNLGGGGSGDDGGASINFRVLQTGFLSAVKTPLTAVARNSAEWSALWAQHSPPMPPGVGAPDQVPPSVDFSTEMVAAVFLGTRSSGGYTVSVLSVEAEGTNGAMVSFEERQPGPGCIVTTALTEPYVMIAMSRVEGPVSFDGKVTVYSCP